MSVLDDQKFTNGVLTPIPDATLKFYFDQGWGTELVLMIAVEHIKIGANALKKVEIGLDKICPRFPHDAYCANHAELAATLRDCGNNEQPDGSLLFDNNPHNGGKDIVCFQALMRALLAAGLTVEQPAESTIINKKLSIRSASDLQHVLAATKDGYQVDIKNNWGTLSKKPSKLYFNFLRFKELGLSKAATSMEMETATDAKAKASSGTKIEPADQIALVPRSPDAMIYYLGEVTRAWLESSQAKHYMVTIWSPEKSNADKPLHRDYALYIVNKGAPDMRTAVEIADGGETYWIPAPCAENDNCQPHRSMQAIAFVNQVFGMLREQANPPAIPSITVLPN